MNGYFDDVTIRDYAPALKEAIRRRREHTLDFESEAQLGRMCINIAMWAMTSAYNKGKLWTELAFSQDFRADIVLGVVSGLDKVDIEREPKEVLIYLFNVGRTTINDRIKNMSAKKRTADIVPIDDVPNIETDFYSITINKETP